MDRDWVESIRKEVETTLQGRGEQSDESIVLAMIGC